ncbi:putative phage tail protein [Anaerocolumna chitinilytica]|uniref:Uncharacterized protein n=1 Tax=Anaerocolumna chitinilytica TaxID=1727145 RepID=A0A7M3S9Y4_9FIRM|nr:putative phage tail protein [Anaerocolumna chitinilytica]BCK01402.1 hypothetical protein bsdcttw_44420 [Anaerocolumna chitinilytica]
MINYIKYTVDGKTYSLIDNGNGTWSKDALAPSVAGNYSLVIEINENGQSTFINADDSRYNLYLEVIASADRVTNLKKYMPDFLYQIKEIKTTIDAQNLELDIIYAVKEGVKSDLFIKTASNDAITREENFLGIKGQGTLEQRKNYILSLKHKGNKLNESTIKNVASAISGSDCLVTFFASAEIGNPYPGYGVLRVRVLSPDNSKDYRYEDIERALKPLVPAHLRLIVIKYFALWQDAKNNFADWRAVKTFTNWEAVKNYIPPM